MGSAWLECICETVRVAKETGMSAWLYDEDRWLSGAAGGLVPARGGDAFRSKVLTVEEGAAPPQDTADVVALFAVTMRDRTITALGARSNARRGVSTLEEACQIAVATRIIDEPFKEYRGMSDGYNKC